MRTGIMGGTFDPIHMVHLILGERAYEQFGLDRVLYLPAGYPPHKLHREGRASNRERLEMTALAIRDNPHFELCDLEMREDRLSYSYETLEELQRTCPDDKLFFIIGGDSLRDFESWKKPERICRAAALLVAVRNHEPLEDLEEKMNRIRELYGAEVMLLDTCDMEISSSEIREMVHDGRSIRYYVPEPVREYILQHQIYSSAQHF